MGLDSLGRQPIQEFASSLHKNLAGQGNSLVLVDSPPRDFSNVASKSSRKRLFKKTCVSGYAKSRYAKTVSVDGAEEII